VFSSDEVARPSGNPSVVEREKVADRQERRATTGAPVEPPLYGESTAENSTFDAGSGLQVDGCRERGVKGAPLVSKARSADTVYPPPQGGQRFKTGWEDDST
jgi:hypothetical protein